MFSDGCTHSLGANALKDLLHSKHNLSYLHWREAIQFPHGNPLQSPLLTLLSFLSLWASGHQEPQVAGGCLSFQCMELPVHGVFVRLLAGVLPPLEPKLLGQQNLKLQEQEAKMSLVGSLGW